MAMPWGQIGVIRRKHQTEVKCRSPKQKFPRGKGRRRGECAATTRKEEAPTALSLVLVSPACKEENLSKVRLFLLLTKQKSGHFGSEDPREENPASKSPLRPRGKTHDRQGGKSAQSKCRTKLSKGEEDNH